MIKYKDFDLYKKMFKSWYVIDMDKEAIFK